MPTQPAVWQEKKQKERRANVDADVDHKGVSSKLLCEFATIIVGTANMMTLQERNT